jgi:hypothetical protein
MRATGFGEQTTQPASPGVSSTARLDQQRNRDARRTAIDGVTKASPPATQCAPKAEQLTSMPQQP